MERTRTAHRPPRSPPDRDRRLGVRVRRQLPTATMGNAFVIAAAVQTPFSLILSALHIAQVRNGAGEAMRAARSLVCAVAN